MPTAKGHNYLHFWEYHFKKSMDQLLTQCMRQHNSSQGYARQLQH
jgi:hypothetical protein